MNTFVTCNLKNQEEVNFFGQLAHPNIISLLGFCNKNEHEHLLVYEHMNTSLSLYSWRGVWVVEIRDKMRQKGAFGYLKADYDISTGHLFMKNDICSFGLVMLETLTRRHLSNLDDVLESLELRAPKSKSNRRKLKKMMDPRLKDSYSIDGAFKCMALALRCTAIRPEY
ncbi:putative transferase [Helianthus anomalus]